MSSDLRKLHSHDSLCGLDTREHSRTVSERADFFARLEVLPIDPSLPLPEAEDDSPAAAAGAPSERAPSSLFTADASPEQKLPSTRELPSVVVPPSDSGAIEDSGTAETPSLRFVAETLLPTPLGKYRVLAFVDVSKPAGHSDIIVMVWGRPEGREGVPLRVHDQCFTSEVLGSLKCDCREQLDFAKEYIQYNRTGCGMIIYLPQEGRGIGLANKIKAYAMQELGYDTVDANRILGFPDDTREYGTVPLILEHLKVRSVCLLTNNPRKIARLRRHGVRITGRVPVLVATNPYSDGYLTAKRTRMGHLLAPAVREEAADDAEEKQRAPGGEEEEEEEEAPSRSDSPCFPSSASFSSSTFSSSSSSTSSSSSPESVVINFPAAALEQSQPLPPPATAEVPVSTR